MHRAAVSELAPFQLTLRVSPTFTVDNHVIREAWKKETLMMVMQNLVDKKL